MGEQKDLWLCTLVISQTRCTNVWKPLDIKNKYEKILSTKSTIKPLPSNSHYPEEVDAWSSLMLGISASLLT